MRIFEGRLLFLFSDALRLCLWAVEARNRSTHKPHFIEMKFMYRSGGHTKKGGLMANEKQLIALMESHQRLWTPSQLCEELGIHVCDLVRLVGKARTLGASIKLESSELTGYSSRYWLDTDI